MLGEGKGYTCIRRFKVDEKSIGVHHAQRLKLLERLLDYCNAKLTLRESLFTEQDDLGRPRALGGATVALDRDAARKAVLDVLVRSGVKGPPPPDAFSDPVTLDKFENHCEMVLVKAKRCARASWQGHGRGRAGRRFPRLAAAEAAAAAGALAATAAAAEDADA